MSTKLILVVGNDSATLFDIHAALKQGGVDVAGVAASGREALRLVDARTPDLVLMDERLEGEMDGVEAAGEIYRRYGIPVILLTVYADDDIVRWAQESGPLGYLLKPVDFSELKTAIEVGLYKHQMERELKKATLAAEAANRAKTSFLATISHELRTPMNGMLGMAELLLLSDLDDPYRENVHIIKDSAMSLLSVLNQIIDYSKLEASPLKLREMDFRIEDLVTGILSQYKRSAKEKGVAVEYSIDPGVPGWLRGDSGKLRQIVSNLVNNAVKFTPSGQVLVDISSTEIESRGGDDEEGVFGVRITVQDTGIGIPADKQYAVFESFNLAEDYLSHASGGLGLGLAIVNRLLVILDGTIVCASEEGKGSAFSVSIPFARSKYELYAPSDAVIHDEKPLDSVRVLVAEDDLINQRYIVRLLEKMGATVSLVDNGEKAVDILKEATFDVVLMDVEMPGLNGTGATRAIRDIETGCLEPKVPIIALTAHAMWGDEQRCIHAGMDDYVPKPVDIDTIAAIIQSNLNLE